MRRFLIVFGGLAAVLCMGAVAGMQVHSGEDLHPAKAVRMLREGRAALEEIVGAELLEADVPPLPEVPDPGLSQAGVSRVARLADSAPESWTPEDRAWVEGLLPVDLRLRAALRGTEGEALEPEEVLTQGLGFLKAARLLAVRDRLALMEGDERAFLDGVELRLDLAERLWLQQAVVGALVGGAVFQAALADVQRAVERAETSGSGLARLEALLLRWRLRVPDAAAVLAREGLFTLEQSEERSGQAGGNDPEAALLMAPVAQDFALLARRCREEGCHAAVEALQRQREERDSDPYRVIADLLIPNLVNMVEKVETLSGLARLAEAAVALRLEAEEAGRYPAAEDLPDPLPAPDGSESAGRSYERRPDGGVRLGLADEAVASPWPEPRRAEVLELFVWELPPPGDR
jgi:hypothetical protein